MSNHYFTLKFQDLPELLAVGERMGLIDVDGDEIPDVYVCNNNGIQGQAKLIVDVMVPGTYDADGNELTPPVPVPGVFVNLVLSRNALSSELRAYRVAYGSAGECWAGSEPEPGAWPPS